jgi:hypothetical protein
MWTTPIVAVPGAAAPSSTSDQISHRFDATLARIACNIKHRIKYQIILMSSATIKNTPPLSRRGWGGFAAWLALLPMFFFLLFILL